MGYIILERNNLPYIGNDTTSQDRLDSLKMESVSAES